jgi:flagellar hook-associated protein 1 FlgK
MSIQGALNTALMSLNVLQQQTNLISNNIANATTPGYAQETLSQSAVLYSGSGAGVMAGTAQRLSDAAAAATANQAAGAQAYSQQMVAVLTNYTSALGQASDPSSLPGVMSAFNTALTTLSTTPGDGTAQSQAVTAAGTLTNTFQNLSNAVATGREQADQGIAAGVADVNSILDKLAQNETSRSAASSQGVTTAPFDDTRGQLLAQLSNDLPIKVFDNGPNGLTVTTDQGTTLWDGTEHKLSFTATPNIPTAMRVTADPANGLTGGLSAVTVNGQPIQISDNGSIAANLHLRDVTLPQFADQLDQTAGNLILAFQQADPSVGAGQTGLFTAGGSALTAGNAASLVGVAGTIAVNAAADPTQGGAAWRIQSGVQAATQGAASDNATVLDFVQALSAAQPFAAGSGLPASMSVTNAASQVAGLQQSTLSTWTDLNTSRTSQAHAAQAALTSATGVSVDEQMQRLLIVQQTYAASAQVMQTAASMLNNFIQTVQ